MPLSYVQDSAVKEQDPVKAVKVALEKCFPSQTFYLYLLDEITWLPVEAPGYPVKNVASDDHIKFMATNLPLIQKSFECLKMANSVAGFLRVVGVPAVNSATMTEIQGLLEFRKTSVQDFRHVEQALDEKEVKNARGPALRELERFFELHDKHRTFAGLTRSKTKNGRAVWTRDNIDFVGKAMINIQYKTPEGLKVTHSKLMPSSDAQNACGELITVMGTDGISCDSSRPTQKEFLKTNTTDDDSGLTTEIQTMLNHLLLLKDGNPATCQNMENLLKRTSLSLLPSVPSWLPGLYKYILSNSKLNVPHRYSHVCSRFHSMATVG
ncbi:Aste57867_22512 [Aphanomyces stellatus]|uniref:Aste57867_22512 protein n=1 Tax=Aphanomyces stellatus TaxID=120398 RepID=A0A485LQ60_9STRA|nr:hypothetical protein As57867_022442 [Aphanomyces stellatus]VFT99172.1 Aste57867_22512 [Aphanomyces stellatus]